MTNEELVPQSRQQMITLKAFYGEYELELYYDGALQWTHELTLDKGKAVTVDVTV